MIPPRLKTTRTFARLAEELEAIAANDGPEWQFMHKHGQFWDAIGRYDGSESLDHFERRVRAAQHAMFGDDQ